MISIRSNFFYTRTVPCELWFFDRGRPEIMRDRVLMIDARSIYRKVTRKIYDFSPEQLANISAIVWLYRGETKRFLELLSEHLGKVVDEAQACFESENEDGEPIRVLPEYAKSLAALRDELQPFLKAQPKKGLHAEALAEFDKGQKLFANDVERFKADVAKSVSRWEKAPDTSPRLNKLVNQLAPLAESSRDLIKQADLLYKLVCRLIETCENECDAKSSNVWVGRDITRARKTADEARRAVVEQLKQVRYFWRHAHWLTERFPDGKLCDVEGLVKLVDRAEIEANDWSLTPGRYVGVAPEEDDDFDFEEALRDIHVELEDLNTEAITLAATIKKNFEELGV